MKLHYKQYPPKKKYEYVENLLSVLFHLHRSYCDNQTEVKDSLIYSAIVTYFRKIFPQEFSNKDDHIKTQYIFILPNEYLDENFTQNFLCPLLQNTPWMTATDCKNKVLFCSQLENIMYYSQINGELWGTPDMQRERKYIICNLEKVAEKNKVSVKLDTIRMVYDKDIIAASEASVQALGKDVVLFPKLLCPTVNFHVSIDPSLDKMKKLAKFIFLKVFAASPEEQIGNDTLLDYYRDNEYYPSIWLERLLFQIVDSNFTKVKSWI